MTRDLASSPHDLEGPGAWFPTTPVRVAMPGWYPGLLDAVAGHGFAGLARAITTANQELVGTYWAIGKDPLEREGLEGWGTKVVLRLSADLGENIPGTRGFSPRNLRYMKSFA